MKKKTFIMGLAALALAFGSAGVIGGVSLSANDSAVMTRAANGDKVTIGEETYIETYRTGFESCEKETSYTSTKTIDSDKADGLSWTAYLGNVTTTSAIDNLSVLLRHANKATTKPYLMSTSALETAVAAFQFSYKVTNLSLKFDVEYSSDGENWTSLETVTAAKKDTAYIYSAELPSAISGFKLRIIMNSYPTDKCDLIIDNIVFAKIDTTPSVGVSGEADVIIKNGVSKEIDLAVKNLPESGSISVETGDPTIATATISENKMTVNALAIGKTTYTVSMKDSSNNVVASCSGKITVSAAVTNITLTSDFVDRATLKVGSTHNLVAGIEPASASQDVVWSVSDENAASVSSSGVLTVLQKTTSELVTVTASAAADASFSKTLSFYIDKEFALSDLVSKDGTTLPNGLVSGSTEVSTQGTVTAIEGKSVYIQSGNSALMVYAKYNDDSLSALKIGDGVKVNGTITLFNGVTELTSPSATVDENVKETITPLELTADGMIAANTSRLVSAYGAKCLATTEISGTSNIQVDFELSNGASFKVYIKKDLISTVSSSLGNFTENSYYDIKGIYCLYGGKTSQIIIDEGCFYYPAGTEEVKKFIADYITGKDGEPAEGDTCKAKYDAAKDAYDKLSKNAKALFTTGTDYAEAYATYTYWENHQSSASSAKLVNNSNTTDWTSLAVIGGALLLAAGACVYFFYNKKKKQNR